MAAGINYNNVWAARGVPVDVIAARQRAGRAVRLPHRRQRRVRHRVGGRRGRRGVAVGDDVVVHPGVLGARRPGVVAGDDPMLGAVAPGSGATTRTSARSRSSASPRRTSPAQGGAPDAGRRRRPPRWSARPPTGCCTAGPGTPSPAATSCWCGAASGGVGIQAIQLAREAGGAAGRGRLRRRAGRRTARSSARSAAIDRTRVRPLGHSARTGPTRRARRHGRAAARAFGKRLWEVVGERGATRDRVRAPRRGHDPDRSSSATRRDGRHLRRDDRLLGRRRPAVPLDAPEAPAGLARHQRRAGARVQRARPRRAHRSLPRRRPALHRGRAVPPGHARRQARPRQHRGAGRCREPELGRKEVR